MLAGEGEGEGEGEGGREGDWFLYTNRSQCVSSVFLISISHDSLSQCPASA